MSPVIDDGDGAAYFTVEPPISGMLIDEVEGATGGVVIDVPPRSVVALESSVWHSHDAALQAGVAALKASGHEVEVQSSLTLHAPADVLKTTIEADLRRFL